MDQRTQFIADHLRDALSITELCELYGISRKTGYKWIDRYVRHGPAGLEERSRRPRRSPRQTSDEIVTAILDARRRHPRWVARNSWPCCTGAIRGGSCRAVRRRATS
jgi:transposase